MALWGPALAAGVFLGATLPLGGGWFAAAVLVVALVALTEAARLLARSHQRPLVPASAVAGLGVPVVLLAGGPSWERVPLVTAAGLLSAFVLALVVSRRRRVVTLGATVLVALLVGLGAAGLLVLRSSGGGFRWTLGVVLLSVAPAVAATVADRAGVPAGAARIVVAGAIAGALVTAASPPFTLPVVAVVAAAGLVAGLAAPLLVAALGGWEDTPEATAAAGRSSLAPLVWLAAPLLAAPPASFVALALQV